MVNTDLPTLEGLSAIVGSDLEARELTGRDREMLKMVRVSAHMVAAIAIIITGIFVFMMFVGKRLRSRTERT